MCFLAKRKTKKHQNHLSCPMSKQISDSGANVIYLFGLKAGKIFFQKNFPVCFVVIKI